MHARIMRLWLNTRFEGGRLVRMSSGDWCLVRDLGPVKGGKGLKHHEVVLAFRLKPRLLRSLQDAVLSFIAKSTGSIPPAGLRAATSLMLWPARGWPARLLPAKVRAANFGSTAGRQRT